MITIQAHDIEVQLRLLKRKYRRKKRSCSGRGPSPSPAHSPCPYDPGDPDCPAILTSHMRSHIRQSIVEASAAGWCDTGLSAPSLGSSDNNNLPVSGVRISGITSATPFFLLMFSQRAETLEPSLLIKILRLLDVSVFPPPQSSY